MRISILTCPFFHDATEVAREVNGQKVRGQDRIIYGGGEKYLVDLCKLLQEDDNVVTVYQPFPGIQKPFTKQYKGITFVMIPNNGGWEYDCCVDLNWQFNEYSALDDIRIYFTTALCWPNAVSPCIAISHGITWDVLQGNKTTRTLTDEQKKEFFKRQFYGFTAPDVVVSVDSNVRKVIQAMEPGSERKIQVIYNYCDTEKFFPAPKTWNGINVLFPRRLTVLRGSTEVTKAFINLPQYNFTLAGQAHDDAAAQAFFKSHEHRKNVKFIHREMDDMPEVYRQADISLVPTISTEGLSLSALESAASGLPIITTPVGGLGDFCIPGYNALVYDPNHEELSDYIQALAEDEETRIKFGKRNREIAVECFDIELWRARWRNVLAQFGAVPKKQYTVGYDAGNDDDSAVMVKVEGGTGKVVEIKRFEGKTETMPGNPDPGEQVPGSELPPLKEKTQGEMAGNSLRKVLKQISDTSTKSLDEAIQAINQIMKAFDNSPEYKRALEANKDSYSDVSKGLPAKLPKPKLVAMMLTHNEAGRYLEHVIENTLLFCDKLIILDDHSDDYDKLQDLAEKIDPVIGAFKRKPHRIFIRQSENSWENESDLRQELLTWALEHSPDWLIAIDADELYEADRMNEQLPYLISQTDADWIGFRFFDTWDDEQHYRDDDIWPAGAAYSPRMFRVRQGMEYKFAGQRRHCGSIPANILKAPGINSSIRVKHLGWMKQEDRDKKYLDRITDDPNNEFFPQVVYDAILDTRPTLVKWDISNPWQTSKLTIAYPPGMEWNVMQQRPHHLMKLAASERYRVFFGDDSAQGTYEPLPYLTVVKDWESIKEVDILYVTSPEQMERCKNIKYKKLVYDCCDWQDGKDFELIVKADIVLCASKLLYDDIGALIMHTGQTGTCCIDWYKRLNRQKLIYLPNACDFDHFSKTGEAGTMLGEKLPEPVIAYMGCIHPAMIDESIVNKLAESNKILLIGQNKGVKFNSPNIYEMGHVKYQDLPKVLSAASVCIIPFRTDSDYLRYSAPIKVWEYLSSGRSVIASPIPELIPLAEQGLIHIVENSHLEDWLKAIEEAIKEYPNIRGVEFAKTQTWQHRWAELQKILEV